MATFRIDARELLEDLVGETVYTIDHGDWNRILRLDGENVIVATQRSPNGARLPVAYVQNAADELARTGEIRISPTALGHRRSSFVGAVLAWHPHAVGLVSPSRVRLHGAAPIGPLLEQALALIPEPRMGPYVDRQDPLFGLMTRDLRDAVAAIVGDERSYKTQGSAGQGNWAETPWVSVFDLNVTDSAARGYYLVYLFRSDGQGVYLSLNQGTTAVWRTAGGREYERVLAARATAYGGYLADQDLSGLLQARLDLGGGRPPLTPGYEAGNVLAFYYLRDAVPGEPALEGDLRRLLRLYRELIEDIDQVRAGDEDEIPQDPALRREARRLRWHLRAEGRNRRAVAEAKRHHGYRCQVCERDFTAEFGERGKRCIDAHHTVPFQELDERPRFLNPITDFAIVCANCHRLIHSAVPPLSLEAAQALSSGP